MAFIIDEVVRTTKSISSYETKHARCPKSSLFRESSE